ncbi:TRAM domain-containing protein [Kocuria sp. LUK]|uniref:class I SAM-dependent RNA methyltransferase n=1 Tax=Kocuria sp. LUK TaxID=2897828 RepID=UPI001E406ABD|nr:TRAM domain-containing protein [Kocuria sp. LUK]MCD1144074.1 TRAM domain-containing protein [Kocuria sp. LUK]
MTPPAPADPAGTPPAELELRLGPVAHGGHTVARTPEGRVVFVRHGLPGERVRVRLTDAGESARYWRADVVAVLEADPARRERHVWAPADSLRTWAEGRPPVGGAELGHAALPAQRALKAAVVAEQLRRLAGLDGPVEVEPMPGEDPEGLGWRTRVHFAVDAAGRIGMHPHRSTAVVPVADFPLALPGIGALGLAGLDLRGVERVDVAAPVDGGAPLVHLELAAGADEDRLRRETARLPAGTSVAARPHGAARPAPWAGRPAVVEHAGDHRWEVSAGGFWQIHRAAPELLHRLVPAAAAPQPGGTALDLYAGAGLFTAALADAVGETGTVVAVEGSPVTSADARRTFAGRPAVRVERGSVDRVLARLWPDAGPVPRGRRRARRGAGIPRPGAVVLDPPRAGAGREVVDRLIALAPRRIAYLACDPATLARDLGRFRRAGWRVRQVRAFDMYPNTHHVETLAVLEP